MGTYNPMAGFQVDPWTGQDAIASQSVADASPFTQFGYGMNGTTPLGTPASVGAGSTWGDFLFGSKNTQTGMQTNGALGSGLSFLQGIGNIYMGMKQYGLAKDSLNFSKEAFNKNYEAQRQMTNTSLMDRQRARVASNAGAYQSVGDYMAQNGVR